MTFSSDELKLLIFDRAAIIFLAVKVFVVSEVNALQSSPDDQVLQVSFSLLLSRGEDFRLLPKSVVQDVSDEHISYPPEREPQDGHRMF
jgi:hypothetical protein